MRVKKRKSIVTLVMLLVLSVVLVGCGSAGNQSSTATTTEGGTQQNNTQPIVLKLAHQWAAPVGDEGDYRSLLAAKFAEEVEKRTNGSVKIDVYPANALLKESQQYDAMLKGSLDLAVWAPFYDAGKVNEFSISLMPGIFNSFDSAWKWLDSEIGAEVEQLLEDNGIKMLVWTWAPLTIANVGDKPIMNPEDVKGLRFRGAGKAFEKMFEALGAGIVSLPSSELYTAMQTNVLDVVLSSYSSFMSYNLYEVVDHFLYPGENALSYAMMPLVMSKQTWDNVLNDEQRKVIEEVAAELQEWVKEANAQDNEKVVQVFRDHGVNVYEITPEQRQAWTDAAQVAIESFASSSEQAKRLIDAALKVD